MVSARLRPSGVQAAPVFSPGWRETRRARPPPAETIQRSGLPRRYEVNATSPPPGEIGGQQAVGAGLGQHQRARAVHVEADDLVAALAGQRDGDARAEDAGLAGEVPHDVVGELVDGVAHVGALVAVRQHRGLAVSQHVEVAVDLHGAARRVRDLDLGHRLRADLRPERRRESQPLVLEIGGERRRVEQVEDARDVEVARLGVERGRGGQLAVADGLRQRQPEQIAAGRRDADLRQIVVAGGAGVCARAAPPCHPPGATSANRETATAMTRTAMPCRCRCRAPRPGDEGEQRIISCPFRQTRARSRAPPDGARWQAGAGPCASPGSR